MNFVKINEGAWGRWERVKLKKTADSFSSKKEKREIILGVVKAGESVTAGKEAMLSRTFSCSRVAEGTELRSLILH